MWKQLLDNLIHEAIDKGHIYLENDIKAVLEQAKNDPLEAAATLEETFNKQIFRSKLSEIFKAKNDQFTETRSIIIELGLSGLVTTNYDECLENAYSHKYGKSLTVIRMSDREELTRWMQRTNFGGLRKPLVHLHGIATDPKNMILTADDYARHYADNENLDFIKQMCRSDRLLAVGFGFSDPFLTHVAEGVLRKLSRDTRHFALIGCRTSETISTILRKQFIRKYRLAPIFYQIRETGSVEDHSDLAKILEILIGGKTEQDHKISSSQSQSDQSIEEIKNDPDSTSALRREFHSNLLISTNGAQIYVDTCIYYCEQSDSSKHDIRPERLEIQSLWSDNRSYFVYCGSEYGGSTLCRKVALECSQNGDRVFLRDARNLPNYKRKLQIEFETLHAEARKKVLVLDNFDANKHERLANELIALSYFDKIVICASKNGAADLIGSAAGSYGGKFHIMQLLGLDRSDIRSLASALFDSNDSDYISSIVEKVYVDLLQLCIPLTPLNVVMYLQIIQKEGDFIPLNRIQILDRYINQLLRKPSDDYLYALNARGKIDLISTFVHELFAKNETQCTELDWYNFCRKYKDDKLISFDERELLSDLDRQRIFLRLGSKIFFRYRLFYAYFLGRHVANREILLERFLTTDLHTSTEGLVDAISNFSTDNSKLIEDLISKLDAAVETFHSTYIPADYDPFEKLEWRMDQDSDKIWKPLMSAVESGPASTSELDKLKSSWLSEMRTEDQSVVIERFDEVERKLIAYHFSLADAIVCAENASGSVKIAAIKALYRSWKALYQVALLHAPIIARNRFYFWNGLLFCNEIKFSVEEDMRERVAMVLYGSIDAICDQACRIIGSRKVGEVFRHISRNEEFSGFTKVLNYSLILRSKPQSWEATAKSIIISTDKKAFYMKSMLDQTFYQFRNEVNTHSDREKLKYLIAVIRSRRDIKSNNPSSSLINRVLGALENAKIFEGGSIDVETSDTEEN